MERKEGWYFVKSEEDCGWEVGMWIRGMWQFAGDEDRYSDDCLSEINETPIKLPE